ncbi:hypothetical protein M3629_13190 [Paenibacillus polysaccharolyticus]|uniref:hypothetical protein n=1 Tax=Paenibacillus polysaccharolyticus TaxID=582692 RepID=UPI00203B9C25|nr:hypothetical protein [Paenibacillus polysaccharolyticus]MCM3133745.1 hypothetical protein [Paenibacillus polysaccharolyticus]
MNLTKILLKELQDGLKELSFEFEGSSNPWVFVRSREGYVQEYIEIDKSNWEPNAIRCTFQTGSKSVSSTKLERHQVNEWYMYQDKEELRSIFKHFLKIIEQFALPWFAKNTEFTPPPAPNYLEGNWRNPIENFVNNNKLNLHSSESVEILDQLVIKGLVQDEIYYVSYCFGEIIRNQFGGQWRYDAEKGPRMDNIGGIAAFKRWPHTLVNIVIKEKTLSLKRYFEDIAYVVAG